MLLGDLFVCLFVWFNVWFFFVSGFRDRTSRIITVFISFFLGHHIVCLFANRKKQTKQTSKSQMWNKKRAFCWAKKTDNRTDHLIIFVYISFALASRIIIQETFDKHLSNAHLHSHTHKTSNQRLNIYTLGLIIDFLLCLFVFPFWMYFWINVLK